jgi:hypothetical protein
MRLLADPDIQGNIHRPYGRYGFPHTRHLFFHVAASGDGAAAGRRFVEDLRLRVTSAAPWPTEYGPAGQPVVDKPLVTLNVGFTWWGLLALGVPLPTLRMMPDEFIQGMAQRKEIVGDIGRSDPEHWDPIWWDSVRQETARVHVWVSLSAQGRLRDASLPVEQLEEWTAWLLARAEASGGHVRLLRGHLGHVEGAWQDSAAVMQTLANGDVVPTAREHFGFNDGIGDPVFAGQHAAQTERGAVIGNGKLVPGRRGAAASWQPLATGEFILGHADEAGAADRGGTGPADAQRDLHGLAQAAPERRQLPPMHRRAGAPLPGGGRHCRRGGGARDPDGEDGRALDQRHSHGHGTDLGRAPSAARAFSRSRRPRPRSRVHADPHRFPLWRRCRGPALPRGGARPPRPSA